MSIFSTQEELAKICKVLSKYIRLPFSGETIPGAIMEAVLASVKKAEVLNTYDFIDVIKREENIGWQVKATKEKTPVTWKRAKIPNQVELINASKKSEAGIQQLGNAIINFCNSHVVHSFETYHLEKIGYCRLVIHDNGKVTYFEKHLCNKNNPILFNADDFVWRWSKPKQTKKKEQLSALHGVNKQTGKKWWTWHGLGENQLHFSGEHAWWPAAGDTHMATFSMPTPEEKLSLQDFMELIAKLDNDN
jgi:hypothetical protein